MCNAVKTVQEICFPLPPLSPPLKKNLNLISESHIAERDWLCKEENILFYVTNVGNAMVNI